MTFLDVSWVGLFPKDLALLAKGLSIHGWVLRNLNLSYNKLYFQSENPKDVEYSKLFMKDMAKFFKEAMFLNHGNFSGMNFSDK